MDADAVRTANTVLAVFLYVLVCGYTFWWQERLKRRGRELERNARIEVDLFMRMEMARSVTVSALNVAIHAFGTGMAFEAAMAEVRRSIDEANASAVAWGLHLERAYGTPGAERVGGRAAAEEQPPNVPAAPDVLDTIASDVPDDER